jgi:hypothetical protein
MVYKQHGEQHTHTPSKDHFPLTGLLVYKQSPHYREGVVAKGMKNNVTLPHIIGLVRDELSRGKERIICS